jgi:RNA polymerase sigma factor (sigma-70 family)
LRQIRKLVLARCPTPLPDAELLQQFIAEGDEAAFAALVQRHGTMVLGVCRGVLHHQQDAEDVFQATFLVLARRAHTIRKQQSLGSWLHGVAFRLALRARAQARRRQGREQLAALSADAGAADDLTLRELRVILHEELHRLPEKYRAPLLLCYWEGKTRDEAADQLGMTGNAFKKYLERARNLLGSRLARRGLAPSAALFATLFSDHVARATVSGLLTRTTAEAAVTFAAAKAASAPGAATAAVTLAEGAIRAMYMTKWATLIVLVISLGGLGTGVSLVAQHALQGQAPLGIAARGLGQQPKQQPKATARTQTDKERLVGTWRVTQGRGDGKDLPPDFVLLTRLTFTKEGKLVFTVADESKEGKYKLVEPGQIDLTLFSAKEELSHGIYKFEGKDRLRLCLGENAADGKRPAEFTGEKPGLILLVLARARPGEEKLTPAEIAKYKDSVDKLREAAARTVSANNLRQIGIAMHLYHDANKALPLHAIYSKDGKTPLLSWRVAILPYIEQLPLYNEFKLDEPWDSPHNKKLIPRMPRTYVPPGAAAKKEPGLTYYQVFTGPGTLFDGSKKMTFQDITDGTSNTLLAIEAKEPGIWSKPADLKLPADRDKLPPAGGLFKSGINALLCDGSVRFLPPNPSPALLRALVTPNGGEKVE